MVFSCFGSDFISISLRPQPSRTSIRIDCARCRCRVQQAKQVVGRLGTPSNRSILLGIVPGKVSRRSLWFYRGFFPHEIYFYARAGGFGVFHISFLACVRHVDFLSLCAWFRRFGGRTGAVSLINSIANDFPAYERSITITLIE